jgi:putative transposase
MVPCHAAQMGMKLPITKFEAEPFLQQIREYLDPIVSFQTAEKICTGTILRSNGSATHWRYLYRAIYRSGALVDVMFSEHRDMAAAKAFLQSAKMVTGITPDRVTTDGHDSYPRAIRATLGTGVRHRDSQYLNNRLEQDHRGVKGRYGPMRGFKCPQSAGEFCRAYDELRNFLRSRSRAPQKVSADDRRFHFLRRTATVLSVLQAA